MNKSAQYIVRNNLLIIVALAVIVGFISRYAVESSLFLFSFLYIGQVILNLVLGLRHWGKKDSETGAAPYFLSVLLVLIIGFGSCAGIFAYLNINGGPPHQVG